MEGGIAILLIVIILLVVGGIAVALFGTSGVPGGGRPTPTPTASMATGSAASGRSTRS